MRCRQGHVLRRIKIIRHLTGNAFPVRAEETLFPKGFLSACRKSQFTKNITQKVFARLFQKAVGSRGKAPGILYGGRKFPQIERRRGVNRPGGTSYGGESSPVQRELLCTDSPMRRSAPHNTFTFVHIAMCLLFFRQTGQMGCGSSPSAFYIFDLQGISVSIR